VVVLCSVSEGFPYTLIEAMACGRPCVATDVGGVSEALGDDAGLIVPPRNPAALADACLRLLRDERLRKTIGTAARARALEHFTVDRAISAFDEMYTLLGTGRPIPAARLDEMPEPARRHWIALPPEDESTVIMPRLSGGTGEPTVALAPLLADAGPALDSEPEPPGTTAPTPPDQQATMVLPQLTESAERGYEEAMN
jgi:hypothetical protein